MPAPIVEAPMRACCLQPECPARVLDIARGTGFVTQHLNGEVVGVDQSSVMVEGACARLLEDERGAFVAEAPRGARELIMVDSARRPDTREERELSDAARDQVDTSFFTGSALASELGGGEILYRGGWSDVVPA